MSLVVPHTAEIQILKYTLALAGNVIKLFSNNITVTVSTVIGSFTEVSGGGYASQTLSAAAWGYTAGTPTVALYNTFLTFTFTGAPTPATVYGYYVVDVSGNLLFAENIALVAPTNGSKISVQPRLTLQSVQQ